MKNYLGKTLVALRQKWTALRREERWALVILTVIILLLLALLIHAWQEEWPVAVQERVDAGKKPMLKHYIQTGLFWGTLFNVVIGILTLVFSPVWLRALPVGWSYNPLWNPQSPGVSRRVFWVLLALAVLVGGGLRAVRLELSIYNDEEYSLRSYIRGTFVKPKMDLTAEPVFTPVGWDTTFFATGYAPNPVLFSVTARASLTVYQALRGTDARDMASWVFRFPSFLAGLGLIAAMGVLGRQVHSPIAGVVAAWLTAFHPWLVRYTTEGRGYALMLLFVVLSWNFLLPALRSGQWRWWLGYGVSQFLMLYAYLGAVYVPVVQNLLVLGCLWVVWARNREFPAWTLTLRWALTNQLAVCLLVFTLSPVIPQLQVYFEKDIAAGVAAPGYLGELWTYIATGMPWNGVLPSIESLGNLLWFKIFVLFIAPALFIMGAMALARRNLFTAALVTTAIASPIAGYFHNMLAERFLFLWYLIWATPLVILCMAVGIAVCSGWLNAKDQQRWHLSGIAVVVLLLVIAGTQLPALAVYLQRSKQGLAPAVVAMQRPLDPSGASDNRVISIACWVPVPHYDPHCSVIYNRQVVEDAIALAERENRPLAIAYGQRQLIQQLQPEVLEILEDARLFEPVTVIPGLEEESYATYVARYRGTLDEGEVEGRPDSTEKQQ